MARALAIALCVPTVFTGLQLDDYALLSRMKWPSLDHWAGSAPFDLFRWFDPVHIRRLVDGLGLPWWTYLDASCAFLRPLSSLTHALDYALFPRSALLMHVHNLLWFGLLMTLAARVYHSLLGSRLTAGLAAVMFALNSSHGPAVSWISNRNALIAGAMSLLALLCHHRARSRGGRGYAVAAWLCFALALLSGELAVGVVGYLFAYTLFMDRATAARRSFAFTPYVVMSAAFAVCHRLGGYGSFGLGAYLDPIAEPRDFLRVAPQRWLILISSQLSRLCADFYPLASPRAASLLLATALCVVVLGTLFVWPSLKRHAAGRCLALGAALSALPMTAAIPSDRLLVLVGFGVMPVLALAIGDAVYPADGLRPPLDFMSGGWRRYLAAIQVFGHVMVDPFAVPITSLLIAYQDQSIKAADASVPSDDSVTKQVLIVAGVPDSIMLTHLPTIRDWNGVPRPERLHWMYGSHAEAHVERISDNALRVSVPAGLYDSRSEARGPRFALKVGDQVTLSEMTIRVLELNREGRPSVCDFEFARPLESSIYRWMTWQGGQFRPFAVPTLGRATTLPPT
jgi:hypothetical protein